MALAYYGVCLPDKKNWVETPEQYVIFRNCVIGRTGFQRYKGYELDRDELMEQGYPCADEDEVELFRSADEVFSAKTIASFMGKSVTDGHPSELLSIENVRDHEEGQIINVRRGNDALESGDYPLLADLVVKSRSLIDKIKNGLRELSCGYNYRVLKDGNLIKQVDIIGNHVAVVENARAGREAVIVDSSPVTSIERFDVMNLLDIVFNTNRKSKLVTWAKDAKPEEVADVIETLGKELETRPEVLTRVTVAKNVDPERERLHLALDKALNGEGSDGDAKELKAALFKGKDKKAVDKKKDDDDDDEDDDAKDAAADKEADDEEEEEETKASDEDAGALVIEPEDRPESLGPGTIDSETVIAARVQGANAVLKQLKPLIARSGNKKLIAAYDTAVKTVNGKAKVSTPGGYGSFAVAATKRSKEAQDSVDTSTQKKALETISGYEKQYAERFNVTKR